VAVILFAAQAAAQGPPRFPSEARLVELDVAVTRGNKPVRGLTAADFQVRDSGVLQVVEMVEPSRTRVQAILLLDTSGSVAGEKLEQLKGAALSFVEGLSPEDSVTLLSFAYRVRLLSGPGNPASAGSALRRLAAGGTTAIIDAVAAAAALAEPGRGRPLLLVFSDGDDRVSWLAERTVIDRVRRTDIVVHGIAFAPPRDVRLQGLPGFLGRLAPATGGQMWYADDAKGLGAAFRSVLEDVRERYVLRYQPTGVPGGGYHPVQVDLRRSGLRVRCRPGYDTSSR
jgi:VWFA-related protein